VLGDDEPGMENQGLRLLTPSQPALDERSVDGQGKASLGQERTKRK
jgi:hypothetical protein